MDTQLCIINGKRPKIHVDTPHEYAMLMKQCWDGEPSNRPTASEIADRMGALLRKSYEEIDNEQLSSHRLLITLTPNILVNDNEEGDINSQKILSSQVSSFQSWNITTS
ncbi:4918_t:CDS:1, partial [Acaulospora colombiana]